MNRLLKKALLLAGTLALTSCSSPANPPLEYTVGQSSLPSINELVDLGENFQFAQSTEKNGISCYTYSSLSSGLQAAQNYAQALKDSWTCRVMSDIHTGADADFSSPTGQVVAVCKTSDPQQAFVLTIEWAETTCTVSPSLMQTSAITLTESTVSSVTLEEAVETLKSKTPQQLGLTGESMAEYLMFAQDGIVMLDNHACICVNVYLAETHRFQQSYLLTVPDLTIYQLDRTDGHAYALN